MFKEYLNIKHLSLKSLVLFHVDFSDSGAAMSHNKIHINLLNTT